MMFYFFVMMMVFTQRMDSFYEDKVFFFLVCPFYDAIGTFILDNVALTGVNQDSDGMQEVKIMMSVQQDL